MPLNSITSEQFIYYLKSLVDNPIEIRHKESLLATCTKEDLDVYQVALSKDTDKIAPSTNEWFLKALKMSGLVDFQITFNKSDKNAKSGPRSEYRRAFDGSLFNDWFKTITKDRALVPDTNILMNRSLSMIARIIGNDLFQRRSVWIPRLCILELERKAQSDECKDDSVKQRHRLAMYGLAELNILKNERVHIFPEADIDLLEKFSRSQGAFMADAWIRKEVKSSRNELFDQADENQPDPRKQKLPVFLTSDLVNGLAAISEGMDTLYLSFLSNNDNPIKAPIAGIAAFLVACSVLLENVNVKSGSKSYEIRGFWSGKTPLDWTEDRVQISDLL